MLMSTFIQGAWRTVRGASSGSIGHLTSEAGWDEYGFYFLIQILAVQYNDVVYCLNIANDL